MLGQYHGNHEVDWVYFHRHRFVDYFFINQIVHLSGSFQFALEHKLHCCPGMVIVRGVETP